MTEPLQEHYGINLIVFGGSKVGKSTLGDTTPAPRLVLDAEAGSRFTPSRKVRWDPASQKPPVPDGTWDTALVAVRSYRDVLRAYEWLASGQHPFRSVVLDSISEIQQRAVDDIAGSNVMQTQDWGTLLRNLSDLIRKFRDLVSHPTRPLDAIVVIAMARQGSDGTWKPFMQGQIATLMPYYVDVCSYLGVVPLEDGTTIRRLFVGTFPGFETGERVGGRLGTYVDGPNISTMLAAIRGEAALPVTSSTPSLTVPAVDHVETLNLNQEG